MKIRTMRRLDFWLGIPMCFILSCVNKIGGGFAEKGHSEKKAKKIIFIKLSEMGAISLAYPLIANIKNNHKEAELFFLTFEKNKNFFGILGGVVPESNIYTIRETSVRFLVSDTMGSLWKIRKQKMDIAFDLEMLTRFSAVLTYLTGAIKKIGFSVYNFEGLYRGNFLTHKVQYNPLQHISHSYLSLGKVMDLDSKSTPEFKFPIQKDEIVLPEFFSNADNRSSILNKLKNAGIVSYGNIFLINPGEWGWPFNLREWPIEHYIDLVKRLLSKDKNRFVVLVGSPGVSNKPEKLCMAVSSSRCIDFTGKTTISELLELFLLSKALITSDSGLAHFAALTPIAKFIFFGPETPQVFGPLGKNTHTFFLKLPCSPCFSVFNHRNSACRNNHCLKKITVDCVYDRVISSTN